MRGVILNGYPQGSQYNTAGYFNNLSETQSQALVSIKQWIKLKYNEDINNLIAKLTFDDSNDCVDLLLLRYLRSKNFNVLKVKEMIEENIKVLKLYQIYNKSNFNIYLL